MVGYINLFTAKFSFLPAVRTTPTLTPARPSIQEQLGTGYDFRELRWGWHHSHTAVPDARNANCRGRTIPPWNRHYENETTSLCPVIADKTVKSLEAEAIHIFRDVAADAKNPVFPYSVGKDSATTHHHPSLSLLTASGWRGIGSGTVLTLSDLHFHDLRHEAISRLFELGLNIPEVAVIPGHKDPRMLFRYTHVRAEELVKRL